MYPDAGGVADSLSQKSCEICFEAIPEDEKIDVPCGHHFCRECWASYVNLFLLLPLLLLLLLLILNSLCLSLHSYLEVSVKEGGGKDISCPGHDCSTPVPMVRESD